MKTVDAVILLTLTLHSINGQSFVKFFRKDYTYVSETESFYKIHTLHKTWEEAKKECETEWSSLFYPKDTAEAEVVLGLMNKSQPFYWIYVGISDSVVKGVYETIDGFPILDVYNKWGPGEPNNAGGMEGCVIMRRDGTLNDDRCDKKFPYICKKTLASLEWNSDCDLPDPDYKYDYSLERCYKFHLQPKNWTEAYKVCNSEDSYLAVVNSQAEAEYFANLTAQSPKDKVKGNYLSGAVLLGFQNRNGDGWKTIRGGKPLDSGYCKWGTGQPDGGDKEQCGSMFYDGTLNDLGCDNKCFFICEHEVQRLTSDIEERFGED